MPCNNLAESYSAGVSEGKGHSKEQYVPEETKGDSQMASMVLL